MDTHISTYIDIIFIVIMSLISIINQLLPDCVRSFSSRKLTDKPSPSFRWIRNGILMWFTPYKNRMIRRKKAFSFACLSAGKLGQLGNYPLGMTVPVCEREAMEPWKDGEFSHKNCMGFFNSYVKLPEGMWDSRPPIRSPSEAWFLGRC